MAGGKRLGMGKAEARRLEKQEAKNLREAATHGPRQSERRLDELRLHNHPIITTCMHNTTNINTLTRNTY